MTGQQLFATNTALSTLGTRVTALENTFGQLVVNNRKAFQGVAMGFASTAAPLNLANGESGMTAGVGTFEGQWAAAIRAQAVTSSGVGIGANVGFSKDAFGAGVGASIKF